MSKQVTCRIDFAILTMMLFEAGLMGYVIAMAQAKNDNVGYAGALIFGFIIVLMGFMVRRKE